MTRQRKVRATRMDRSLETLMMPREGMESLSRLARRAGGAWLRCSDGMPAWGNGPIGNRGPAEGGRKVYPAGINLSGETAVQALFSTCLASFDLPAL